MSGEGAGANARTVLHIATERGWRGGERQVLWLAQALERIGWRSVIVARAGEPLATRAAAGGLAVHELAPASELDAPAALAVRRLAGHTAASIVHAHTGHAVTLAALATIRHSARMVVTRRVDFPLKRNPGTRWKYGRARALIAVSSAVAEVMKQSGVPAQRITVVPDGVDLHRDIAPASPSTLSELGVSHAGPLVVQVCALVPHKDPLTFVRAVAVLRKSHPDVQALLVGDGQLRNAVHAEHSRLRLSGTLHVPGWRVDADELLAAATVVTLSSREEGMGSVLLDACALGKPIAACRAGGIPEVVEDERSGLLVPREDPAALAAAMARLLDDRALATRCAAGARERARLFSADVMAARTASVYELVLGARSVAEAGANSPRA